MRTPALALLLLAAGAAWAEPDPQLDPNLASPPIADEGAPTPYGVVPGAPKPPAPLKPRLRLDATLNTADPVVEAKGLKPSDSIIAPADAAAFEAEESSEPAGRATRR